MPTDRSPGPARGDPPIDLRPDALLRLIAAVYGGARRPRLLADLLGWELRVVHEAWALGRELGLLEGTGHIGLSPRGLRVAIAAPARRAPTLTQMIVQSDLMQSILADGSAGSLQRALRARAPMAPADQLQRRAAGLRPLLEPALLLPDAALAPPRRAQLPLPIPSPARRAPGRPAIADLRCGTGENPDTYAIVLRALLGAGELSPLELRALLDAADAKEAELPPLLAMGARRGDLHRVADRLLPSVGAAARPQLADDGISVALSDPAYQRWMSEAAHPPIGLAPGPRRAHEATARRFLSWDARIWGESLAELRGPPAGPRLPAPRGEPEAPPPERPGPWLQHLDEPGLLLAFPPAVRSLARGLTEVNPALRRAAQGPPRRPTVVSAAARVHGGLLSPGEAPPRILPDRRTLRLRALLRCPVIGLLGALLLLDRDHGGAVQVRRGPQGPALCAGSRPLGPLIPSLVAFCRSQGWAPLYHPETSLQDADLWAALVGGGWARAIGARLVLDDALHLLLHEDDEGRLILEALDPLRGRLSAWLAAQPLPAPAADRGGPDA